MNKYWSVIQSFPQKATVPHLWHLVCVFVVMHVDINYRSVSLQSNRCATGLGSGGGGRMFSIRPWSR